GPGGAARPPARFTTPTGAPGGCGRRAADRSRTRVATPARPSRDGAVAPDQAAGRPLTGWPVVAPGGRRLTPPDRLRGPAVYNPPTGGCPVTTGRHHLLWQTRLDLEQLARLAARPARFAPHEAPFRDDPHISRRM